MTVKDKIKLLPKTAGVYTFKNSDGDIIYVGKAVNLANRVRSYFLKSSDPKTKALRKKIADVDYFVVSNEVEALLLENILIKKHQPRYNIALRDSKSYPFIKITNENLPRVIKCREKLNEKDEYYGPFINVEVVHLMLKIFSTVLKIRPCKRKFTPPYSKKPCLNYHIGRCSAPCASFISERDYLKAVEMARDVLKGNSKEILDYLTEKMNNLSREQKYEQAAIVRDQIKLLENYNLHQYIETSSKDSSDYIGVFCDFKNFSVSILQQRNGKVIGRENFIMSKMLDYTNFLSDFLNFYYLNITNIPPNIYIPEEIEETKTLEKALKEKFNTIVEFRVAHSIKDKKLLHLAKQNAEIYFEEKQYKIEKLNLLREIKKVLALPKLPRIIEGIDIATLSGKYSIGSLVHFVNLKPVPSEYRIFNLEGYNYPDDYAMIEEVVMRRYQRIKNEKMRPPDLILIDGGKGQLNAAYKALKAVKIDIPVVSIAKKEELIFLLNKDEPVALPKNSQCLKAIQRVRDEAHRFCNSRIIKKQIKSEIKSELMNIKGIGKKRLNILLKRFGSIKEIEKANLNDIANLETFNLELAKRVHEFLLTKGRQRGD